MSDVVLVLGMHRSGTSAVAGTFSKLGCMLPTNLMAANFTNVRGFFESESLMSFHDELLESAGSTWSDWRLVNPGWYQSSIAKKMKYRAKTIFETEFGGSPLVVLKNPRICRIAPFWLDVLSELSATPHIIMPIRSPLDVAQSMRNIHGFSFSHCLLLWLRHVLDAELCSRGFARAIFEWTDFQKNWRGVCNKIADEAQLSWPRMSDRASYEIEKFLSKDLVHHVTDDSDFAAHTDTHEWVLDTYQSLQELARNPLSNSAQAKLDDVRGLLDKSSVIFGRFLVECEIDLEVSRAQAHSATSELAVVRAQQLEILTDKSAGLAELGSRLAEVQKTSDEVARERDALTHKHAMVVAERDAERESFAAIAARLRSREHELEAGSTEIAALAARLEANQSAGDEVARERDALARNLETVVAELDAKGDSCAAIAAQLLSREHELEVGVRELATLDARLKASQNACEEVARERDALAHSLAASSVEREALVSANARLIAEFEAHRSQLGTRGEGLADFSERIEADRINSEEATHGRDAPAHNLSVCFVEPDAVDSANDRIAGELELLCVQPEATAAELA